MSLTIEQIIEKEKEYFNSDIAAEPAYIVEEEIYNDNGEYVMGGSDKCVYKTEDGRACAVGCLFLNKFYEDDWDADDGTGVSSLPQSVIEYLGEDNIQFLMQLQTTHDELAREYTREELYHVHFGKRFLELALSKFPSKFSTV